MRVALFGLIWIAMVGALDAGIPLPGTQVSQQYVSPDGRSRINYLLALPREYGQNATRWPVVVFLHGSGERGDDLSRVKIHGPPKLAESRPLPFILISPQCPRELRWREEPVFSLLKGMLDDVTRRYSIDSERIVLTGLSMGGQGTWYWASQEPYRFSAIAPICGKCDPEWGQTIVHLPIWVFHGGQDAAVPLAESERIVEVIREAGGDPRFTIYPEVGHDSWTVTYENPEVSSWLLTHKKQSPPPKVPKPLVAPRPD